jgi:hypothetical protein
MGNSNLHMRVRPEIPEAPQPSEPTHPTNRTEEQQVTLFLHNRIPRLESYTVKEPTFKDCFVARQSWSNLTKRESTNTHTNTDNHTQHSTSTGAESTQSASTTRSSHPPSSSQSAVEANEQTKCDSTVRTLSVTITLSRFSVRTFVTGSRYTSAFTGKRGLRNFAKNCQKIAGG